MWKIIRETSSQCQISDSITLPKNVEATRTRFFRQIDKKGRAIWSVPSTFVCSPILFLAILCTYVLGYSTCEIIISDCFAPAVSTLQIGQYDNNKSNNSDEKTEKASRWKWRKTADEKVLFRFFFAFAYSWQK